MKRLVRILLPLLIGLQACIPLQAVSHYDPYQALATKTATRTITVQAIPQPPTAQPKRTATPSACRVTAARALNLRKGPGLSYSVIAWLRSGESLIQTNTRPRGAWQEVINQAGVIGWVNSEYCA